MLNARTMMAAKDCGIDPELAAEAGDTATACLNAIRRARKAKTPAQKAEHVRAAQDGLRRISPRQHPELVSAIQAKLLALQGRGGDTEIAHVTPGEVVIPRNLQTPAVMRTLAAEAARAGIDPRRYTVGNRANSVNPRTGKPEFGEIEEVVVTDRREFHPGWGGPEIGYQPDDPWRTGPGEGGIGGGDGSVYASIPKRAPEKLPPNSNEAQTIVFQYYGRYKSGQISEATMCSDFVITRQYWRALSRVAGPLRVLRGPAKSRHNLLTKHERLLRLERSQGERKIELTDGQIRMLERFSPEFRDRHIEAPYTGALVGVDTFFVGAMKGVGKIYLQTAIDCHSRHAWARLYTNKMPVTAVHLLNTDVLPTFEAHDAKIAVVLSDNGREFCGRPDNHPYELFLQLEEIEHRTTRVKRPQSNGFVERLHRTLLDEHFRVEGRRTWFETVEEMQASLDAYLVTYNTQRPHQGRGMNGRTPATVFVTGLPANINQPKEDVNKKSKSKKAA